ncbi:MAG: type IV pili methyl-accepting chemotaxis transducer N-terminal domain-containing protein [Comamonadaceae bacterium]|jgi:twitching motility protein PilJ|uniref:methyl-accepting chemotaxis protein n=1 Tax=Candidatus Skiveiella danica TaxID=3386177 RepID=UPI001B7C69A6|nr:type IV pili methyl-accepting chemotaxis transducer N-terminal domain-containing protein [Comamonadaceae bacterium]MBK9199427.1 type IV pili methyl-accepting chemotaxis transducer N-terminal domain-containing protein [Betaproteobacteria bacterium]MBP7966203.1 type IV pili methyl-accepting chemotaxis transducer N-terminal domain-containing protein [Burkholderiaceae bacterium]MBK6555852.1 type IV pili methyl-accepting chemotaxis transducer N-terminal domain-containing protein [Comamonadaceae ba
MSVIDQINKLLGKNASPAQAPTDASPAAEVFGDQDRADDRMPAAESGQFSTADFPDSKIALGAGGNEGGGNEGAAELLTLPVLGTRSIVQHQRILAVLLGTALVILTGVTFFALNQADKVAQQVAATGQALMQSQRLAKSVSQALVGSPQAFPDVRESAGVLAKTVRGLRDGDSESGLKEVPQAEMGDVDKAIPLVDRAEKSANTVMSQQKILTQVGTALRTINRQSSDLLEIAETISSLKLQQNAAAAEISASGQLVMLTQRIGKSANEFLTMEGVSPEAVFLLGKDLNSFKEIGQGLLDGSPELRLAGSKDPQTRERLEALLKLYEDTRGQAGAILGNLQGLVSAREAQASIVADSEPLRRVLEDLQAKLSARTGLGAGALAILLLSALLALLFAGGLAYVQLQDSRQRQRVAESQRLDAERQEQEAKRVNDANQAAILRLMNELQTVAEGDLTQEATVTEDITGAIADSVNYTVEELRMLVGNVQNTVTRVAQTTSQVENTSTELLAASTEQLREIRETGQSVLDMAARINVVSSQAQESASVARNSLMAAESGLSAVQNAIGGMNSIRDQIQETSKRIKRLGESSQEIGEITELISDITEQTNVLALNAAIQAASAGEAGRGFSVVAEEVQRLAERSADATRQISALVKAIQTDTQDAVAAMERSTQGVVEGARLSDNAGTALTEIDRVSRQLADLIAQISDSASREAVSANEVAGNIQHIFAVTEQTGEGTRSTANQVRELSRMAEELRESVARFKIA